ncbi:MAG: hypothetical protein ACRC63_03450, partial [Metamycoplasmataceae bacterium]
MKNKFKKMALSIMAFGGFISPLAIVASCNSSAEINYNITSINHPELTAEDVLDNQFMKLETLEKVFNGINEDNLKNLTVTKQVITNGGVHTLVLNTKNGYTIQGKNMLVSEHFTLMTNNFDYNITKKINPQLDRENIDDEEYMKLSTLEKVFDGINENNLKNLTVSLNTVNAGKDYIITLNANHGYTINGLTTLISNQLSFEINLIISPKILNDFEILAIDVKDNNFRSFETINKLFHLDSSITEIALNQAVSFEISPMIDNQPLSVKLIANNGYTINDLETLDSNSFILPINYEINKNDVVPSDIKPSDIVEN